MILEFLLVVGTLILILFYRKNRKPPNYPPVARLSFPVLGHMPYFQAYDEKGLHELFWKWGKELKSPIIGVDFGSFNGVIINDYKWIKQAFNYLEIAGRMDGRAFSYRGADEGINRGIIFSFGNEWVQQRRFSLRQLKEFGFGRKSMEHIIVTEAIDLVKDLIEDAGKPISTSTRFNPAVVNSIWQICAGERFEHNDPKLAELVGSVIQNIQGAKIFGTIIFMQWFCKLAPEFSGWNTYAKNFKIMDDYLTRYVDKRIQSHKEGDRNDFIDVYLEEILRTDDTDSTFYKEEGRKQLINTLGDIFSAGSDTTSTTMSWISLYLALHPHIQKKLQEEIDHVIGKNREPALTDAEAMPYTQAVIEETLRLSSIVPLAVFHRSVDNLTLNGVFIPKDATVIANIYGTQHDPEVWGENADEFVPERFLSEDGKKFIKQEGFISFSAGKRVCIGENLARNELFLYTTFIWQSLEVKTDPNSPTLPSMKPNVGGTVYGPKPHQLVFNLRN